MSEIATPKSLKEVLNWKEQCWNTVAHLPLEDAFKKRMRDSARCAAQLGFVPMQPKAVPALLASDGHGKYRVRRKKSR